MRRNIFNRFDLPSVRLAISYLAIIMVLSISFSTIFYRTSTVNLNLQLQPTLNSGTAMDAHPPSELAIVGGADSGQQVTASTNDIYNLNAQLQKNIAAIRTGLLWRLLGLNIGALFIGGVLSYYLARRTLQPMESAMDTQARFASDASHELRTPLTVMQAEIEVVLKKTDLSVDRAKAALRSNYQEVTRLKQLSEGLLRLAHNPQSDNIFSPVNLDEVINDAMNQLLKPAQAKHITIDDTVPRLSIQGDRQGLVQVLVILLDNAIKYSPQKCTVHIEGRAQGKHILLSVSDEGPGIRATDLPHIFERFYRADPSRSAHKVSGYGLGLSIAQKIVQQHHGEISAASTLGQGATFTVKLPA